MIITPILLNISRYSTVSANGYVSEVLSSSFSAVAEVQAATADEIQSLPSNERDRETLKLYFDSLDREMVRERDRFIFKGSEYRIISVKDFSHLLIPHIKVLAVKME